MGDLREGSSCAVTFAGDALAVCAFAERMFVGGCAFVILGLVAFGGALIDGSGVASGFWIAFRDSAWVAIGAGWTIGAWIASFVGTGRRVERSASEPGASRGRTSA